MTIDDVRARLEGYLGAAMVDAMDGEIRALLDDHARLAAEVARARSGPGLVYEACAQAESRVDDLTAEVARLTRERDAEVSRRKCAEVIARAFACDLQEQAARSAAAENQPDLAVEDQLDDLQLRADDATDRAIRAERERDRLAAALAEVREAAEAYRRAACDAVGNDTPTYDRIERGGR